MKKLLFSAVSLDIGGIENALVNLLNYLARTDKYEITLFLEKKEGIFLENIFSQRKTIRAKIKEMELVNHKIILEAEK